ncbi:hypothetical protein OSB04_012230 [Centaurea solstitialis]|uniref:PGG domain-containing protein n=1 Tax=Centaurea solstitialis TaxID=347529 RepID=A0AA38WQJ8_9ASTR|nr:hypothetical protein OSB04_012230 [Centaurea solstitialis]
MSDRDLELQNENGETALYVAARVGNHKGAMILMEKNKCLIDIPDSHGRMPLYAAVLGANYNISFYLYRNFDKMSGDLWTHQNRSQVLEACLGTHLFDIAMEMLTDHPELAINGKLLRILAQTTPYIHYPIIPPIIRRVIVNAGKTFYSTLLIYEFLTSIKLKCLLYTNSPPTIFLFTCFLVSAISYEWVEKVRFLEDESNALKLLRIFLNEIMKMPKAEIDDIMRGPPDETKKDAKQSLVEKQTQEALQLLTTISENVGKMAANIFNVMKKPAADEKETTRKDTNQKYSSRVLFLAVEKGNTGFVTEVVRQYPHLALEVNDNNQSILHVAALHRPQGILKLLIENKHIMNTIAALQDENGNNMLHLVANGSGALRIPRSILRLNQEYQWFREVYYAVPRVVRTQRNASGLLPIELFYNNHKDLFSNEEKRIKDTASQLMVVAALVATISFAAVFTFPGGYNQDTGIPIFLRKNLFKIFIIFDSLSFISSTTSVLMVLSIIHSKYTAFDLVYSKPNQLGQCVALVFFSIATIIITFLILLFILYGRNSTWMPILISVFAAIPYLMFAIRQYQLRDRIIKLR